MNTPVQHLDTTMSVFKFPGDLKYVKEASHKVLDFLSDLKLNAGVVFDIKLCFEEAFINAVKYGNKGDSRLTVDVEVIKHGDSIELVVRDHGEGFEFKKTSDPRQDENLLKTSGRGVFLIISLMDKVVYEKNGSCLRMIKNIKRREGL